MQPPKETFTVELPVSLLTDAKLSDAVASITTNAPNSDVYKNNPPIQATVTAVITLGKTWLDAVGIVAADELKLVTDKQLRDDGRLSLTQKLQLLRSQIQDAAPTAAAAKAMGVNTREGNALPAPLLAPAGGTVKFSMRVKGQFTASAAEVTGIRTYRMQLSLDAGPPVTWTDVEGHGKSHTFKGYASGTHLWLRFAATRGKAQSAWSDPILVVVP